MRAFKSISNVVPVGLAALLASTACGPASTIWNGPNIGFYHTQENLLQDQMTADVKIDRGSSLGLYNSDLETAAVDGVSPMNTAWAVGTLATFTNNPGSLSFGPCPLEQGDRPPDLIGTTFVVHLTSASDDIYLQLTLTNWGGAGGVGDKTFGYTRSTAAVVSPTVTVSITNPVSGAVFPAPASVTIAASAAASSGTVTNVHFFTNNVSAGSVLTSPFKLTLNNLAAGSFALKAVATAAGISATSAVVSITVVAAPPTVSVSITNPVSGAVFAAPANVPIGASATVSSGSVTNVEFLTNGVALLSVATPPFTVTATGLAAGAYALTAVATAAGISATSAPVNVSVINASPVSISSATMTDGVFSFSYTADPGLDYVVQSSSNLVNWLPLTTNTAAANPVPFSIPATDGLQFYRIARLPNP